MVYMAKKRVEEDDFIYSPREVLAALNNATLAAYRIPAGNLRTEYQRVMNLCGAALMEDLGPLIDGGLIRSQELVLLLVGLATQIQCHRVMSLREMPFGPLRFGQ